MEQDHLTGWLSFLSESEHGIMDVTAKNNSNILMAWFIPIILFQDLESRYNHLFYSCNNDYNLSLWRFIRIIFRKK